MSLDIAPCRVDVEVRQRRLEARRSGQKNVVNGTRKLVDEVLQALEVGRIERCDAPAKRDGGSDHAIGISPRDDHGRPCVVGTTRRLEADA